MTGAPGPSAIAFAPTLTPAEADALRRWIEPCVRAPGSLPAGCESVQRRLVRAVGKGEVAGIGTVFVKVMAFPRGKDRLRYAFRRLPASHEARLLAEVVRRLPDLRCPEPLAILARRRFGVPQLSVLVTRGLPVDASRVPDLRSMAQVATRLADAGVEHLDLHRGNFVALTDGGTGVLDMQSARLRSGPIGVRQRRTMAIKLVEDFLDGDRTAVVDAGLIRPDELAGVVSEAQRNRRRAVLARVRRCVRESSEFALRRSWSGVRIVRRTADADALVGVPDPAANALWFGDRAREVLDGTPPTLGGAFFRWAWLPGHDSVYIPAARYGRTGIAERQLLLAGFQRFRELSRFDRRPAWRMRS